LPEAYEVLPDGRSFERSDDDELAIEIFKRLYRTADAIPSSLIASAEQLRGVETGTIRETSSADIVAIGSTFSPANANRISRRGLSGTGGNACGRDARKTRFDLHRTRSARITAAGAIGTSAAKNLVEKFGGVCRRKSGADRHDCLR